MNLRSYLAPLLPGTADYRSLPRTWRGDLVAGVTVGIVALPLALAFGVSSGVGPEAGLVTAIIAGVVAAVFGGSNVQVSGPTGAMVVVLGPIVALHGPGVVPLLSVLAGVFVVAAGVLKIGRIVSYIPWPVIEGFTLGIAVIIFLQQVPAALGTAPGPSSNALVATLQALPTMTLPEAGWAIAITATVMVTMILVPRLSRHLPGSLIAIIIVTIAAAVASLPIDRIGELPSALPAPAIPPVSVELLTALTGPALTVAALAAIESLLSARVAASISDTGPYDADRELVGQGLASVASGVFGGMPATGAIARTAVNVRSGAHTRLAAITHSLILLAVVYLATTAVSQIPLAALAGVLMVTATRMISPSTVRSVISASRSDAIVFVTTAIVTVSFDLIVAVGIGIAGAGFFALRSLAASGGVHREEISEPAELEDAEIAVFRLDGALFFGAADRMMDEINHITNVSVVILRLSQLQVLDATGARVITELVQSLERRNITVLIKGVQDRHIRVATRVGVISSLRHQNHLFTDLPTAIEHARSHVRRGHL
ncbi:SulP family inorganic anion transporter [Microbacterium sulfonylureivorans]|uniref:SulP family inorganic anion transporter n=1 Tax=Microbacterium sulfonylureivorans TaxID=2486854 RepID=UPI000FD8698B|nr:SulP family inorganic anion transporter [Microbacterium sulfonylureivorans]